MRRRLFNFVVAISMLVCVAICVVWVRSFYVIENRTLVAADAVYEIGSGGGAIAVQRVEPKDGEVRWMRPEVRFSVVGVEWIEGRLNRRRPWQLVLLPYWVPAGIAAILPMSWILVRARREAKAAQRRCPECGHERDVNGTCPACGFAPLPPSPGTPGEGRGEGDFARQ